MENIERIRAHSEGLTIESFLRDMRSSDAVERCLMRISEAAAKLANEAELAAPHIRWQDVRALGNLLRHHYDRVNLQVIWNIVMRDLPPLEAACRNASTDSS